jgi:hypothetical protein
MSSFFRRYSGPLLLFLGGVILIALVPFFAADRSVPSAPATSPPPAEYRMLTYPGARKPPAVPAIASGLGDAEQVVGVIVHGRPRAYALKALGGLPQNHVVNDLVGGTPVTVTYCDIDRCVKAFTGPGSDPLDVNVGGYHNDEMVIRFRGGAYGQKSGTSVLPNDPGRLPLEPADYQLTTWKKWLDAHPDTDVVVDIPPPKVPPVPSKE